MNSATEIDAGCGKRESAFSLPQVVKCGNWYVSKHTGHRRGRAQQACCGSKKTFPDDSGTRLTKNWDSSRCRRCTRAGWQVLRWIRRASQDQSMLLFATRMPGKHMKSLSQVASMKHGA